MAKERFVNENLLLKKLPVFVKLDNKEQAEKLIDIIENQLILEKANEIYNFKKRIEELERELEKAYTGTF